MIRPDAPLIRHLVDTIGNSTGQAWQGRPYVLLPGEGFADYAITESPRLQRLMPTLGELSWPDAVFDFPVGLAPLLKHSLTGALAGGALAGALDSIDLSRGHCWMRIAAGSDYLSAISSASPWLRGPADLLASFRARADDWIAVEVWEQRTVRPTGEIGFPAYPDVTLVPRHSPWDRNQWAYLYPNLACRTRRAFGAGFCNVAHCLYPDDTVRNRRCHGSTMVMALGVILALSTLAYLAGTDDYLVEVHPVLTERQRKQTARHASRGDKSWTREDLPHYILIDPQRVAEYGRPRGEAGEGHHASPVAHSRRGHWRHLRAERFARDDAGSVRTVRVKPTWVGEAEWTDQGQHYKVVPPRKEIR